MIAPGIARRPPAFVWGHAGSALLIGVAAGSFVDWNGVWIFGGSLAGGALVSALASWAWPGFAASWWKLWLMAVATNPLFVAALAWTWLDRECLIHHEAGWSCMFSDRGPDLAVVCLATPLVGLAARWITRRWRGRDGSG